MKVIVSRGARRDLFHIGEWIGRDHPDRGRSFVDELYEACRGLADFPEAYPVAPEFGTGIRKRTYGDYVILYRVGRDITIVAIRHGARRRAGLGRG